MTGRDHDERHRVSSPLEMLFDLTFVVAVAQVAVQLAHSIAAGTVLQSWLVGAMLTAVSPAGRARRASALSDGRVNAS
jgi:low temperature requirement protein LtrA